MKTQIYTCIWSDGKAKEAAEFYVSVFPDSEILDSNPVVTTWAASGQKFMMLNGGPVFTPNPSISFFTVLDSEHEINEIWEKLSQNGKILMPLDAYSWASRYGWV